MDIEPLVTGHDRDQFDCGEPSLNDYIQRYARQNDARFLGRTYVALFPDSNRVAGYYTLASGSSAAQDFPDRKLPRYPIPIARLARLAVDKDAQGQGLGEELLFDALRRCALISQHIGLHAVVVDALHEQAQRFYLKYNFHETQDNPLCLYLTIAEVLKLGLVDA